MESVVTPVLNSFVRVYLDDSIITSVTFTEHLIHLRNIFELLHQAGLTSKLDKCSFGKNKIQYLDFKLTREEVQRDDSKTEAIKVVPPSQIAKDLAYFLDMRGWYQRFIPNYADILEPLYRTKRKRTRFVWTQETQEAYGQLKLSLIMALVLILPDYDHSLKLYTDASSCGMEQC